MFENTVKIDIWSNVNIVALLFSVFANNET